VVFTVLFAASDIPEATWESIREPGDRNLGQLFLQNGEYAHVAARRAPLESTEKAEAEKLAGELRIYLAPDASPENIQGASAMVWFNAKEDGSPVIMNTCLGPGNLMQPSADGT
jgi:hypothetical protein